MNDLGLQINITLSWTEHIKKKLTKANATFFLIRRSVSHLLSPQVKLHLYKTLLMPIILYASQCWSPNKSDLKQLETFQKRVVRWMLPDTPYREAISSLGILPIAYFAVLTDFLTLSKIVSGLYDCDLTSCYSCAPSGSRRTATRLLFDIPIIKLERQRNNFWYRTPWRANRIANVIDIRTFSPDLKYRLLKLMWSFFHSHYDELSPCTWTFLCYCSNCRDRHIDLSGLD